jgi:hypothetical protein
LEKLISANISRKIFTYQEGLNIIDRDFKNHNVNIYYIYNAYIANKLNTINNFVYLLPGSKSSWNFNYDLNIFSYFMYDVKKDPSESFNLIDISNIDYIDNKIKNKLNDTLNLALEEKNCYQLKTIFADNTYTQLANLLYMFGGFVSNQTKDIEYIILGTLNGSNGLDTQIVQKFKSLFENNINININNINSFDLTNPYNLYNSTTNKYYVGNYEYIHFIYTNMPYFSNFVLTQGLPDLTNKKFMIESNNILPLLNVYKII